ncbi:MAG: hypothetical protein AMXMBFR55_12130 [Gemmatimonadota bacterium]
MFNRNEPILRRIARAAMVLAILPATACYHQVVETGKAASPTVIDKPWQMGFVYGLVPPPALNTASQCPGGVAKVETQHSFLNGLVASLTFGLITPMQVTITCAATGSAATGSASTGAAKVNAGSTQDEQAAAVNQAARLSSESGQPVLVQF